MKVNHLTLATTGSLLLAGAAQAAFTGVSIYQVDDYMANDHPVNAVKSHFLANGGGLDVYRIYAEFDAAGAVTATFGSGATGQLMFLTNKDSGVFFNHAAYTSTSGSYVESDTAPAGPFSGADGAKGYDTFATIGVERVIGGVDETTLTSGVSSGTNNFAGDWDSNSFTGGTGGWFSFDPLAAQTNAMQGAAAPGAPADGVWRVLLYQATVPAGEGIEGNFGVAVVGEGNIYDGSTFFTTNDVPAPGALALLGLAGLAGARRRRK